ncbi:MULTISPECIES: flagellar basal-body MS-ring/collar protein FliF [Lysinibacillus]|uniref:Flagellar M-ring protein n=2 Tax=Lysinibacillus TaxID=400634 RepID=A0A2S0K3U4_LYSSH|nr:MULTISPECIES: flagellar basal-body MS-ring/collar protein FliF [Lysinibacillus]AVK98016.1 flagellar M-ring protein FliF [Lysinibacillus sphaericus]MCS1380836.1 flagellar basal-body MS-ring/collar protein FliF [Lysinibacillus sphaericus]MED4543517.1 flagellar basal-body MS-ring/collar protein FliF [Lysinibacillus sphaericus]TKI48403.1 flagellar basal body M-ring protein FliF [Lysinibacillus tabacifolii]UDK95810.1 flagellar M-ring protein FliF [Lysinibacillus sphaericus]
MNERLTKIKTDTSQFWKSRSKTQKIVMLSSVVGVIALAAIITFFATKTTYVPLYKDLSTREIGQVKEALDSQGVKYEIAPGGTSILVPQEQVDSLLVQLASEGYPQTGTIDYSFANSSGFGMTDNEFNLLKKAATETEIAKLIKNLEGVKDAKVMITLPEEGVFIQDVKEDATASIVLNTDPGYKFTEQQIATMYNLVSKSIPNLKTDNIVISNQFSEYFDLNAATTDGTSTTTAEGQLQMKKLVERDLQRQVQNMLGTLMGQDKVIVSVTTDIDFKKENREENLVTPVDEENMEGIAISAQRITEQYSGTGNAAMGTPEAETTTDNFTTYNEGATGNGDYERTEETINNDVNRIRKDIQEAPYKIQDIGIQVIVEPPTATDAASLPDGVQQDIEKILSTIVRTTISKDVAAVLTQEQIDEKVAVSVQPLNGKVADTADETPVIPWWVWVVGGILLAVILLLAFFIIRSRKRAKEEEELSILEEQEELMIDDINEEIETEATMRRKQLEKMAKEKPDDFAKLLRSWIAED